MTSYLKSKKSFVSFPFLALIALSFSVGQACDHFDEVIAKFKPGVIVWPDSYGDSIQPCSEAIITSVDVLEVIVLFGGSEIERLFESNDPEKIIVANPAGIEIVKPTFHENYKIYLPDSSSAANLADSLNGHSDVVFIYANSCVEPDVIEVNDPYFSYQWALNNMGQLGGSPGADINALDAWELETGSDNVLIAIIEQYINIDHEDLSGRAFGDQGQFHQHGTPVMGIATANTNNQIGVAGINWQSPVLFLKIVFGDEVKKTAPKVIAAADSGACALNCSWGSYGNDYNLAGAFAYAYNSNLFSVASAGNDNSDERHYPSSYNHVFAISATNNKDRKTDFSNYGDDIDIANILRLSAEDKGDPGWDEIFGWGRLDAGNALQMIAHPNIVYQDQADNGYIHSVNGVYTIALYFSPTVADGVYFMKEYQIRKDITFQEPFDSIIGAWGRGAASNGYGPYNPNFCWLYSGVVNGSVSNTGMTVETRVFELWDFGGDYVGYVPCTPSEATMAYTVVGVPSCYGMCADANADGIVNVSDVVWIYDYVFIGGQPPQPVLACGDANNDGTVNVSDAVYIINYIFIGGDPPTDCSPGSPNWIDGDCCPFEE